MRASLWVCDRCGTQEICRDDVCSGWTKIQWVTGNESERTVCKGCGRELRLWLYYDKDLGSPERTLAHRVAEYLKNFMEVCDPFPYYADILEGKVDGTIAQINSFNLKTYDMEYLDNTRAKLVTDLLKAKYSWESGKNDKLEQPEQSGQ